MTEVSLSWGGQVITSSITHRRWVLSCWCPVKHRSIIQTLHSQAVSQSLTPKNTIHHFCHYHTKTGHLSTASEYWTSHVSELLFLSTVLLRCELAMLPVERPHCWGIVLLITLVDRAQQRRQLSTKASLSSLVKKKKRRASSSALRKMLRGQYGLWVNRKALKKTFHVLGKLSKIKCIAEDYVGWWPSRLNDDINW